MKLASFESIITELNEANVRYLIVGGLAVAAHGYGRVTFDVDLVLHLQTENVQKALKAFKSLGYKPSIPVNVTDFADAEKRQTWIDEKNMVVFQLYSEQHPETRIDLFVAEPFDFDREYEKALIEEFLPDQRIRFVRIETLIAKKELADREKDREDIRQLKILIENSEDEQ